MQNNSIKKAIIGVLNNDSNRLTATSKDLLEVCVETLSTKFETRVYVYDIEQTNENFDLIPIDEITDEDFMTEAEKQGRVYTLKGFEKALNETGEINFSTDIIRFIQVPVYV
jgi:hypothetical protein